MAGVCPDRPRVSNTKLERVKLFSQEDMKRKTKPSPREAEEKLIEIENNEVNSIKCKHLSGHQTSVTPSIKLVSL